MRAMHRDAVEHRLAKAKGGLVNYERRLLERIANGSELDPGRIEPRLVEVESDSKDELLFRYASLHWSIPVSSGYGRRIRFLVVDAQNEKLIGLIGLGDPVMNLGPRDAYIGWDRETRHARMHHRTGTRRADGSTAPALPSQGVEVRVHIGEHRR